MTTTKQDFLDHYGVTDDETCGCGQPAVWWYAPGGANPFYCDGCVPRGCSCNAEPIDGDMDNEDPGNWRQATDEQGRELPCCEYLSI